MNTFGVSVILNNETELTVIEVVASSVDDMKIKVSQMGRLIMYVRPKGRKIYFN